MKQPPLSEKMATLSAIWESYAQLIRRRMDRHTEQKHQQRRFVLDKFLGHFINISLESKGDIYIGEMRNIANELSQEFMRNVDAVTRSLSEEEATRSLEDYMLRGRGWRLLYTVDRVGVKGVSQRHDLCEVLLNLLPYCLHMKPTSPTDEPIPEAGNTEGGQDKGREEEARLQKIRDLLNEMYNSTQPLSSCFHLLNKSTKIKQLGCPSLQARKLKRVESSALKLNQLRKDRKGRGKAKAGKSKKRMTRSTPSKRIQHAPQLDTEEEEDAFTNLSESVSIRPDERRSKQPRFKRSLRTHMWSPFIKDEESETDDEYVGSLVEVDDSSMTITAYHLVRIILKLLLSLGELDMNQNVRGRTLSSTILPHLLYFVSQFREESSKNDEVSGVTKAEKWLDSQHGEEGINSASQVQSKWHSKDTATHSSTGTTEIPQDGDEEFEPVPWQGLLKTLLLKQVVRAVLTLSGIIATQQNGVRILINLKVVDTLLDMNILDSLVPGPEIRGFNSMGSISRTRKEITNVEAGVAMDMICGLMQLLQTVYVNLPFNPTCINDASHLASNLILPDVVVRINRLIEFCEMRTNQLEKTPTGSEIYDPDLVSSTESSRAVVNNGGNQRCTDSQTPKLSEDSVVGNSDAKDDSNDEASRSMFVTTDCKEGSPVDAGTYGDNEKKDAELKCDSNISDLTDVANKDSQAKATEQDRTSPSDLVNKLYKSSNPPVSYLPDVSADPIRCIGALITTLKGVKVNYIHSMKCLKRRHRNCEFGMYYDHHHDILGVPHYTSVRTTQIDNDDADYEQSPSATQASRSHSPSKRSPVDFLSEPLTCVVSELATILLDYISEAKFKASRIHLMSTLRSVGVCCCLQPEKIISAIVPQLQVFSQAVRSYALDTLTSILLDHFQGAQESQEVLKLSSASANNTKTWEKMKDAGNSAENFSYNHDSSRCVHCYLEGSSPLLAGLPTTLDSGFSSCDIEEMRRQKLLERWKSLRLLRTIILSKDETVALTCAKHLMTLAIRGNSEIKEELFFGVYLHVLHMKVRMSRQCSEYSSVCPSDSVGSALNKTVAASQAREDGVTDSEKPVDTASQSKESDRPPLPADTQCPISILNSQESLNDSLIISGSLSPTEMSSADDSATPDGLVPSSIMLLCVSALPYVLQVDKVMSIFLARGGLAKLTNLLEYEQLRAPVMSVFEALVMIDERRLRGNTSDHKSVYEGGGVIQTFIDTLAKRTCTVTATLQQISLQNSKTNNNSPPLLDEENDFLKFYKASLSSVSSIHDSSMGDHSESQGSLGRSAGEQEDVDVEGGIASSCNNNLADTLPVLLDMWKTCAKLCMNSRMFRACYRESPCLYVVQETLVLALSLLGELSDSKRWSLDTRDNRDYSNCTSGTVTPSANASYRSKSISRSVSIESSKLRQRLSLERKLSVDTSDEGEDDSGGLFNHEAKLEFIEAVMMVCFSCHTISPSQKRGHEDELWLRLNSALQSCIHLEPSKLSAVFQMLLNVALPRCPSVLEYSYSQIVSMLNLREREDIADEDEVRQILQQGLEEDGDTIFTEHGYEGDTECSVCFDWKKGLEYSLENQTVRNYGASSCPCFPAAFRLFVELMVACHRIASRGVILHTVALRLLQTLRSSRRAVRACCAESLLEILVDGFREVLVHCPSNGKQSTLQEIILSLVQVIAQSEVSASELRQFLRLFQDNTETSNSLLSTLLAVIEKSTVTPHTSATFPVKTLTPIEAFSGASDESDDSQEPPAEQAVWYHAAVELDVPGISWPPCEMGFTLAWWMCVDQLQCGKKGGGKSGSKDRGGKGHSDSEDFEKPFSSGHRLPMNECLLVVAIGNKEKTLELWVHPRTATLYCRLTTGISSVTILKDHILERLLTHNKWHLVVLSYVDVLDGSTFVGKLNIILDGWQKHQVILDHPALLNRGQHLQRPFLCIGDARNGSAKFQTGTWKLGTLRLFRDVGLSEDWWFHLYCLGPDCEGIGKCDCGEQKASYTPAMLKHMANVTHLTSDVLVGASQLPDLDTARAAQVLVYKISYPELFSTFVVPHTPSASIHDDLGLVPPTGSLSDLLAQKPMIMSAKLRGRIKPRDSNTLERAVEQAGGIEAFLFLVAKIFEDSMRNLDNDGSLEVAEHLQSKATHILFQLVHQFPSLAQAFNEVGGYAMLTKVLTSSKSIVGYQLLKVLMDACTTESVFKSSPNVSHPVLRNHPEAIIRDIEILSQLLLHWRIWHKAGDDVTSMLFGALEALVSPRHPHANFNLKQMQAGGIMNKIFNIYLERIQDGQPSLSVKVSKSASVVIRSLLGSPPDLHLLIAVMDFLLLVHPAPNGFISYTPGSFYFKLWWDGVKARAASSAKPKPRINVKSSIGESQETKVGNAKENDIASRTAREQKVGRQESRLPKATTSNSSPDDSHDEDKEFKFPPLKATNTGLDQSLDMDADQEESDTGWRKVKKKQMKRPTVSRVMDDTTTSTGSSHHQDTPDMTSSGKETEEDEQRQNNSNNFSTDDIVTGGGSIEIATDAMLENKAGDTTQKHLSPRRKLMYLGSESSEKHSDLELNMSSNAEGGDIPEEEEPREVFGVGEDASFEGNTSDGKSSQQESGGVEEDNDEGLITLCVSLVEYLTHIVLEFPESSLDSVFSKVVSPKSVLVLAKTSSSEMRLAVMKLLGAYLSRAPPNLIDAFIKMDGFYLLANQLHTFPVETKHIEAAISILLRQDFTFNDNFMIGDLGELSAVQQAGPVLLLSLLDGTAADTDLCKNSLKLLTQLLDATQTMSTLLLDLGLAETMCNLATNIQRRPISEPGPTEEALTKSLLVDVQHVLCTTAVSEFSWTGNTHFQNVEDMFTLLKALEDYEFNRGSESSKKRADTARAFQISLVVKIFEYVEKRSEELTVANQGWFTSSVSSNDPPSENQSLMGSQLDSDSSGSNRTLPSPRPEVGTGNKPSRLGSLFSRKRRMIYATVNQSDLLDRFRKVLVMATDLAVMFPRDEQIRPKEQRTITFFSEPKTLTLEDRYLKHLFVMVYRFYEHSLSKDLMTKKNRNPIMHGAKDVLKIQFTRLFLCMMSLKVDFDMRAYALAFIMTEPRGPDAVNSVITDRQVGTELSFYLYNLLSSWKEWLNSSQRETGFSLMQMIRRSGFSVLSPDTMPTQPQVNAMMEEKKQIDTRYRREFLMWVQKREAGTARITQKFESVRRRVAEQAMIVTRDVTKLQGEERKKLVEHIKQAMTTQIQLKKRWQELVQSLSHERGVWYQKASSPQSWQLDPTEGPGRVRKRLQRCHLDVNKKFLLPGHQKKLDAEKVDPPLVYLFEDDHQMSDSAALTYRLYTNEKIQHTCKCTVVSPASESKGELLIGEVCIFFVADEAITVANYTQMLLGNLDQLSITLPHTDIRELHKRWYQLQDVGLEIFLISGRTCLLAFQSTHDRDELYNILRSSLELPNLIAAETLQAVQSAWLEGNVTNYDYLMHLNKLAGRSYTDLMQYPVFPFVLRDYHSQTLNLNDSKVYRNLRKPIAVQDKTREKRYMDNYEFLCQEANRPHSEDEMVRVAPFHYGSHYSNSGTVLHYMVRLPPFTQMFLCYQDSNFDIPDRTFHSLGTSWRLSSFESSTDVKELIPEFFFLPEFLINSEGFDFGQRQNGEQVNHVTLPRWCEGNPRLFTLIHRQALESAFVTSNLHFWIDLVFGYKQQGEEAVKAINVFHPSTYFGVDASGIKDPVKRQALLTMIKTYGQTPKQLFRNPHATAHPRQPAPGTVGEDKAKPYVRKPVSNVVGLKWGNFVGSPDLNPPMSFDLVKQGPATISRLVALPTGLIFGVERNSNILLLHGKQRDMAVKSTDVMWAGIITWGYHDNIIRIRSYKDKPLINFMPQHSCGRITCIESLPDCRLLFTAGTAGTISVYTMTHNSSKPSNLQVRGVRKTLYGHSGPITTLCVCQEFSILVSGSKDGTCIIWDLNRLTYVRSITSHCAAINTLTVSSTLGDIASVSLRENDTCCLQLHTVNAAHVATQEVQDLVNCLAYSCAPEGRSVNVVAGGLESGVIRLWSSWDLSPLRDLTKDTPNPRPVISLTFSSDSQYMMAASSDGSVTLWDKDVKSLRIHSERFIPVVIGGGGEK